jgi:hypothetical protein
MPKLPLNSARLLTLFVAVFSSMGVLSASPANGLTFKAVRPSGSHRFLETFEMEYTLADGIFDTIVSSPRNTFFIDGEHNVAPGSTLPLRLGTVVPEVVTDFSWPLEGRLSIFGITDAGLYLEIINPNEPPRFMSIFQANIQAPAGLPLSACKFQACEMNVLTSGGHVYPRFEMIQTPVMEPQPVPEPSAAIALGFVGALLLKRRRQALSAQPVTIADKP